MSVPKPKIENLTTVVNLKTDKYDVYIGRPSLFGNPYKLSMGWGRDKAIHLFRAYFIDRTDKDPQFYLEVIKLKGKILGCFCKPLSCHGDVIKQFLDLEKI